MIIYLTTHTTTNKMYIGRDKNNSPNYFGSGTDIKRIIKEEGKVNLRKNILEEVSEETIAEREEYWLKYYDVENNPMFYNRTNKAYGCSRQTKDGKKKISKALKGKKRSKEICKKMGESRKGLKRTSYKTRVDKGIKRNKPYPNMSKAAKLVDRSYSYKAVIQYDLEGNYIKTYKSAQEAKNISKLKIQNNLVGLTKSCGGYVWKYKD